MGEQPFLSMVSLCHEHFTLITPPSSQCSTHVAGIACGHRHGIASCGKLCSIKVLSSSSNDEGSQGWASWLIAALEHVVNDCTPKEGLAKTCVVSMALGGKYNQVLNDAVAAAVDQGVTVVVAAGNNNGPSSVIYDGDACHYSPSSEPKAITVASITKDEDASAWDSNYGTCVDVYAPGVMILSAWNGSPDAEGPMSGTSTASACECVALFAPAWCTNPPEIIFSPFLVCPLANS